MRPRAARARQMPKRKRERAKTHPFRNEWAPYASSHEYSMQISTCGRCRSTGGMGRSSLSHGLTAVGQENRNGRIAMAKGQMRKSKEARKPKKEKPKTIAANPSQKGGQRGLEHLGND